MNRPPLRELLPVITMSATAGGMAGAVIGAAAFYAADRIRVLTGHTYRDLRHAGWRARKDRA